MAACDDRTPFEHSDNEKNEKEDLINKNKSLIELPNEKIDQRNNTPPERSKT